MSVMCMNVLIMLKKLFAIIKDAIYRISIELGRSENFTLTWQIPTKAGL